MQNFLRDQSRNKISQNMVLATLSFLDWFGLSLAITTATSDIIVQALQTLTEYCQGPCQANQACIASYETNGIDIIVKELLLVDASSSKADMPKMNQEIEEDFVELRFEAAIMLLSLMETRDDQTIHSRILLSMNGEIELLMDTIVNMYVAAGDHVPRGTEELEGNTCTFNREVGHVLYILAVTLCAHDERLMKIINADQINSNAYEEMRVFAEPISDSGRTNADDEAALLIEDADSATVLNRGGILDYYAMHTNIIEIYRNKKSETLVFPVPPVSCYLTVASRKAVFKETLVDNEGSKVPAFFTQSIQLQQEMMWQRKLVAARGFDYITVKMRIWQEIGTFLAFFQNSLVALCFPFESGSLKVQQESICSGLSPSFRHSVLSWTYAVVSVVVLGYVTHQGKPLKIWRRAALQNALLAWSYRLVLSGRVTETSVMVGGCQVVNAFVLLVSFFGNNMATILASIKGARLQENMETAVAEHGVEDEGVAPTWVDIVRYAPSNVRRDAAYHLSYFSICFLGLTWQLAPGAQYGEFWYSLLLLDYVVTSPTLKSVIEAVTTPYLSLSMTFLLAIILVYLFAILGYIFLRDDFTLDLDGDAVHTQVCTTLFRCILNVFHHGLRSGGGVGDILRPVDWVDQTYPVRVIYDMLFWIFVVLIVLNLLLGIIIDTFAEIRKEKEIKADLLRNNCFICGISRLDFDKNSATTFNEHVNKVHNMWSYLNFLVLLRTKPATELTGPESSVYAMINNKPEADLSWFPRFSRD